MRTSLLLAGMLLLIVQTSRSDDRDLGVMTYNGRSYSRCRVETILIDGVHITSANGDFVIPLDRVPFSIRGRFKAEIDAAVAKSKAPTPVPAPKDEANEKRPPNSPEATNGIQASLLVGNQTLQNGQKFTCSAEFMCTVVSINERDTGNVIRMGGTFANYPVLGSDIYAYIFNAWKPAKVQIAVRLSPNQKSFTKSGRLTGIFAGYITVPADEPTRLPLFKDVIFEPGD